MGGRWKDLEEHDTGSVSHLEQPGSGNPDLEDAACEGSKGSEKRVTRNRRKGNPCYVLSEILATLSTVICRMESRKSAERT